MPGTVTDLGVLAFTVLPGSLMVRWARTTRSVPPVAAPVGDGWVFGETAHRTPGCFDVTAVVGAPSGAMPGQPIPADEGTLLCGLVVHGVAVVGAPESVGTALAVYPTWWNERRRGLVHTAARQVAHNAVLVPVAVAAYRAAALAPYERCVVLEFAERGVCAASIDITAPDDPGVERSARDPDLDLHDPGAGARLEALIDAVADRADPDCIVVTGRPGEPAGVDECSRLAEILGRGRRLVPVAASEMLTAVSVPSAPAPAGSEHVPVVPWLQDVRAGSPEPSSAPRTGRLVVASVAVASAAVGLVAFGIWAVTAFEDGPGRSRTEVVTAAPPDDAGERSDGESREGSEPLRSVRLEAGPVRLDLPEHWRIRDAGATTPGRVELLPASGPDRRIVIVYSVLADGTDTYDVASVLAARAAERSEIIRNLDGDTRFGDRSVIAYTEVPDGYSLVRWSVLVFPRLQVSVGCQYLDGEWTAVRSECEQAVHTLGIG